MFKITAAYLSQAQNISEFLLKRAEMDQSEFSVTISGVLSIPSDCPFREQLLWKFSDDTESMFGDEDSLLECD